LFYLREVAVVFKLDAEELHKVSRPASKRLFHLGDCSEVEIRATRAIFSVGVHANTDIDGCCSRCHHARRDGAAEKGLKEWADCGLANGSSSATQVDVDKARTVCDSFLSSCNVVRGGLVRSRICETKAKI